MKYLLIVNTYYQLILCMQLRNTILKNDNVTVCVTDHSKNSKNVVEKLSNIKIFDNIIYIENKEIDFSKNKFKRLLNTIGISFDLCNFYSRTLRKIKSNNIDKILFYNTGYLFVDAMLSYISKTNSQITMAMFEEGILSYDYEIDFFKTRHVINKIRHTRHKKTLEQLIKDFYCFYPNLYSGKLNTIGIPLICRDSATAKQLRNIFDPDLSIYKYKYIFFTSVYDFEGGKSVGEYELVCRIANLVGKDNLLVKIHPRDTRTIYADNGFNVDKNSSIPWEAIQLSGDFSDKVFMTINSGSVLSGSTMSEKPVRTYYMYKLCDISGNESCKKNARDIESLLQNEEMKNVLKTVHIAEKLEDIL